MLYVTNTNCLLRVGGLTVANVALPARRPDSQRFSKIKPFPLYQYREYYTLFRRPIAGVAGVIRPGDF